MKKIISDEFERLKIVKNILNYNINKKEIVLDVEAMDDAALISINNEYSIAVASDFIRGSGFYLFTLGYLTYFDIGYYLIAANLSDMAAMGAKPIGLNTIIRYNNAMGDDEFIDIFNGMRKASDYFDTPIIGGDIGGYEKDVFAATAFGLIKTENALLRKNVQSSDLLCVTGQVGLPISALIYFKELKSKNFELSKEEEEVLINSWKRPSARINEGIFLAENKIANSCMDISDGVKSSVEQLSAFSGKNFTIYSEKLPINNITHKIAAFLEKDPISIAISASVDFELMFTISQDKRELCEEYFNKNKIFFTIIGYVNSLDKNLINYEDGRTEELPGIAWKQQIGDDYIKQIIHKL